jgi:hypothetical protein
LRAPPWADALPSSDGGPQVQGGGVPQYLSTEYPTQYPTQDFAQQYSAGYQGGGVPGYSPRGSYGDPYHYYNPAGYGAPPSQFGGVPTKNKIPPYDQLKAVPYEVPVDAEGGTTVKNEFGYVHTLHHKGAKRLRDIKSKKWKKFFGPVLDLKPGDEALLVKDEDGGWNEKEGCSNGCKYIR